MDDTALVKVIAAQYVQGMGPEVIRYLRDMQELAAGLSDADSVQAWRDIEDAAHAILLTFKSELRGYDGDPGLTRPFRVSAI
jgi:hypothetical protein